jgi:membrane protease YdiL (CAAX protease family)
MRGFFEQSSNTARVFQLIALTFSSFLLFTLISVVITGGDFTEVRDLKVAQLLQSVGLFVIPPLLLAFLWSREPTAYLKINHPPALTMVLLVVLIMWVAIPAINLLGELNKSIQLPASMSYLEELFKSMEQRAMELTDSLLAVDTWGGLLFTIILVALIPAFGEELFFRGVIQQLLQGKMGKHLAVWLAALIFSAIHFQFYGFIPRTLLGALMGYLLVWSGSLWYPIVAHFVNNATVVVFVFADSKGWVNFDIEAIGSKPMGVVGYLSIGAVLALLLFFRKQFKMSV